MESAFAKKCQMLAIKRVCEYEKNFFQLVAGYLLDQLFYSSYVLGIALDIIRIATNKSKNCIDLLASFKLTK